jgi:phosphoribosyl-AMP cyclohydrolase
MSHSDAPFVFAPRGAAAEIESSLRLTPKFDAEGLIPAIVTDRASGEVLMLAFMNAEALARTIESGFAHFFSRSRGCLWRKGEESGNTFAVAEMRVDCDQDALWLKVDVGGAGAACHTGERSCFYRAIPLGAPPGPATQLTSLRRSKTAAGSAEERGGQGLNQG